MLWITKSENPTGGVIWDNSTMRTKKIPNQSGSNPARVTIGSTIGKVMTTIEIPLRSDMIEVLDREADRVGTNVQDLAEMLLIDAIENIRDEFVPAMSTIQRLRDTLAHAHRVYQENKQSGSPAESLAFDNGRIDGLQQALELLIDAND